MSFVFSDHLYDLASAYSNRVRFFQNSLLVGLLRILDGLWILIGKR